MLAIGRAEASTVEAYAIHALWAERSLYNQANFSASGTGVAWNASRNQRSSRQTQT
jgi:hypothetical protein